MNLGESKRVQFHIDARTLSQAHEKGARPVMRGRYEIFVSGSQPDGDATKGVRSHSFTIEGTDRLPH